MIDQRYKLFELLFQDLKDDEVGNFPNLKPLLAHYTSVQSLEGIIKNNEIWFSNPLFMNDLEELRYGLLMGQKLFLDDKDIFEACGTRKRFLILEEQFNHYISYFEDEHAFNIYAFCLSEHDPTDNDGLLSMWRGYGAQGNGVSIIFDFSKLEVQENTPLICSKVSYASREERENWISSKFSEFATILRQSELLDEELHVAAKYLVERLIIFSLFAKHKGFKEEKEWRVVYIPGLDVNNLLHPMFSYFISSKGIEPKLKLKLEPVDGLISSDVTLDNLVSKIILGPANSSVLSQKSVIRMLEKIGRGDMANRVIPSTIPFRPI